MIPQRVLLALMGFGAILNAYTMRVVLSVAITQLVPSRNFSNIYHEQVCEAELVHGKPEYHAGIYKWSEKIQGLILSSFYWGYIITHIPGGVLAERFGGKWILCLGILFTTITTLLTPIAIRKEGATALIILRVIMGLGQGTTFPALSVLLSAWVPIKERGTLGALVLGGGQVGTILGNSISGLLLAEFEWDWVFYFFGFFGLIWCIAFSFLCFSDPASHPYITKSERQYLLTEMGQIQRRTNLPPTPWVAILTNAPMIALVFAQIGHDWGFYIMVIDLPKYLSDVLRFTIGKTGFTSSLPYLFMWVVSLCSGCCADYLISNGIMSITPTRKLMTAIAAFGPAVFILAASYSGCNGFLAMTFFTIAMGLMGTYYAGMKLNPLDLSPNYSGTIMAITNGIGASTGIVTPYVIGVLTPNTTLTEWRMVFWLSFGILVSTCIVYVIWASGEVQDFDDPDSDSDS